MKLTLVPGKTAFFFFIIVVFLTMTNAVLLFIYYTSESYFVMDIIPLFNLDMEQNIPTLYSCCAILFCSMLLLILSITEKRKKNSEWIYWAGLSLIFLFLSLDEGLKIHERINDVTALYVTSTGLTYWPWVLPYGIGVILISLFYMKFIFTLPIKTLSLFISSGVVFLLGAVGFEMLGAREAQLHSYESIRYAVFYTVEEFLEMTGIVIFIYGLLTLLKARIEYFPNFGKIKLYFRQI